MHTNIIGFSCAQKQQMRCSLTLSSRRVIHKTKHVKICVLHALATYRISRENYARKHTHTHTHFWCVRLHKLKSMHQRYKIHNSTHVQYTSDTCIHMVIDNSWSHKLWPRFMPIAYAHNTSSTSTHYIGLDTEKIMRFASCVRATTKAQRPLTKKKLFFLRERPLTRINYFWTHKDASTAQL
jgi:hypothetical protein